MSEQEELVIPVRLQKDKASRGLQQLGQEGTAAGDKVAAGASKAEQAIGGISPAAVSVGKAIAAAAAISQNVFGAMVDRSREVSDYIKKSADSFIQLRDTMRQVAALQGNKEGASTQFTVQQAQQAQAASMTPEKWREFQEGFQSAGGAYVGKFKDIEGGETAEQQSTRFQQMMAEFGEGHMIPGSETSKFAGSLLQHAKEGVTPEDLLKQAGGVFTTLEKAPTEVAQLLPQMNRLQSQGNNATDASRIINLFSEIRPGEEGTYAEGTISSLRDVLLKGKGDQLGLKKGMSDIELLEAAGKSLEVQVAAGGDIDELAKKFAPFREAQRGLKGLVEIGVEGGGFERTAGYIRNSDPNYIANENAAYERTDAGIHNKLVADQALADTERGAEWASTQDEQLKSRTAVTRSGRLEENRWEDTARRRISEGVTLPILGQVTPGTGVSVEQQLINEETLSRLRTQARKAGIKETDSPSVTDVAWRTQASVDAEVKDILGRLKALPQQMEGGGKAGSTDESRLEGVSTGKPETANGNDTKALLARNNELLARQNDIMEAEQARRPGGPVGPFGGMPAPAPMIAPPANPRGRVGG